MARGKKIAVRGEAALPALSVKLKKKNNWLSVDGEVAIDPETVIAMKDLIEALSGTSRFVEISEGEFVAISRDLERKLLQMQALGELLKSGLHLSIASLPALEPILEDLPDVETDRQSASLLANVAKAREFTPKVPKTLEAELRPYQMEGYAWMSRLAAMGAGACLADDMGLGKTIQTLSILLDRAKGGPALVLAPTSVCGNWVQEAAKFAPSLNLIRMGTKHRKETLSTLGAGDVLVTSYGLLLTEGERLATIHWHTAILDEAQAIKNMQAKRTRAAMELSVDFRIIATGTPIENHPGELFTLFSFANPGLLGTEAEFKRKFLTPIAKEENGRARKALASRIRPFVLRRTKNAVLDDLPEKTEVLVAVEPDEKEAAFHHALRLQAMEKVAEMADAEPGVRQMRLLAELTKLRQAACHPELAEPGCGINGAKAAHFKQMVEDLLENGHRILVFSQFTKHLSRIRKILDDMKARYQYLDGTTPADERQKRVNAFQNGEGDLFLISLKAGGTGLNLTAANYVIHMDPWWNPAVEDQASDRAYRMGQKRPVTVYRLVTKDTIEEQIVTLHETKRGLAKDILSGTDRSAGLSADALMDLIRNGG